MLLVFTYISIETYKKAGGMTAAYSKIMEIMSKRNQSSEWKRICVGWDHFYTIWKLKLVESVGDIWLEDNLL